MIDGYEGYGAVARGQRNERDMKAEDAIRPFVIGGKGWLFSDTTAGAHAGALLYW